MRKQRGCGAAAPASFGAARRHGPRAICALALLLAGCGADPEPNATQSIVMQGNANELIVPRPAVESNLINASEVALPGIVLASDGLGVGGGGPVPTRIAFGTPRAAATTAIASALGKPIEEGDSQECGAGALGFASFRGGLGLYFQNGKFVGWDLDGRDGGRFATAKGIGVGSTRKQLDAAYKVGIEDSTLGIEFDAGGLSGLLSMREASGEVTNLWAGATCIAR